MVFLRYLAAVLVLISSVAFAGGSSAAGFLYDCDFSKSRPGGWVSKKLAVVVKSSTQVEVVDSILTNFKQSPAPGKVLRNDDRIMRVVWRVRNISDRRKQSASHMDYEFRLKKQSKVATVTATPSGFSNYFSSRGTCSQRIR